MKLIDTGIVLSKKEIKKLKERGKLRDNLEIWVDKHNHKLELMRTCTSLTAAVSSFLVLLKVFKII